MDVLSGKKIVLGVCGSIAAYKASQLARDLTLAGAQVDVVMTEAAGRFVGAATFQALTGRPVLGDLWALPEDGVVGHIALGAKADLVAVAPATANTIARIAAGMSDDLLTTTILATRAPVLLAPAMNPLMYAAPATVANVATLRARGYTVLEPAVGRMAEHVEGRGRLPEPPELEGEIRALLGRAHGPLSGRHVVISAGGTQEPIDPVRYIGNRSSGQMGYAMAARARDLGARVTLVSGPTALAPPAAVATLRVETALQMQAALAEALGDADILIMNAAVADFRPAAAADEKIKKSGDAGLTLSLVPNPDIIAGLAGRREFFKVGFAAETNDLLANAQGKLERKGLDMIVANDAVSSIGQPEIALTLIDRGGVASLPRQPKAAAAAALLDEIVARFARWRA
ncbi:bifunctional phosphopantothenoylcysteine decarboxylase/phosphopantothenate--cysteine ligase CoaBC [Oscillochloris sp. ZM17-4]|uniref:bifunctional phosphopantothenoylcysteine decarboxylase/phosphopantothenate--cysteine ligase CoaBC n=1 Tax=Oscillochloris sp. ZM17-4 TaxID=2866714 RepID=UPI001C733B33|nr:bifunctional phosphopantothenoylcysteine decarboxylase/phosphopantothenate--cysteine ligase CoaBC [Oscillochloris sp. ZM17-4]MBX0330815.1 bifunctional phosphopantothenoylcysteine decarboxylase/phosphopantothenate--cysteine ligase CoaBC [Oscillochloris sp. ZM17-4]